MFSEGVFDKNKDCDFIGKRWQQAHRHRLTYKSHFYGVICLCRHRIAIACEHDTGQRDDSRLGGEPLCRICVFADPEIDV